MPYIVLAISIDLFLCLLVVIFLLMVIFLSVVVDDHKPLYPMRSPSIFDEVANAEYISGRAEEISYPLQIARVERDTVHDWRRKEF